MAACVGLLASTLFAAPRAAAVTLPQGFHNEVVFEGLSKPTKFSFAPDGRTFVAQKGGKIVVYPSGAGPASQPVLFANLAKDTYDNTDHGLLGLALDPKFDEGRPYVYALYSYDHELGSSEPAPKYGIPGYEGDACPTPATGCVVSGRLVRLTAEGDHAKPSSGTPEQKVLLEGWCQQFGSHSIGDLAFGPEGALFVSGGDGASYENPDWGQFGNPCGDPPGPAGTDLSPPSAEGGSLRSQSPLRPGGGAVLDGALLRIDPNTGEGWPGNPYATSTDANKRRIIAFGFRNPFRFRIDPASDSVFVDNVGNSIWEEIDKVPLTEPIAPYNSGWPCYEGSETNSAFVPAGLTACQRLYSTPGSTQTPFFAYKHGESVVPGDGCPGPTGSAITGASIYEGSEYPAKYHRALFFADSVRGCFYAMLADGSGEPQPNSVVAFMTGASGYPGTDLEIGPGGELYYCGFGSKAIQRISYGPGVPEPKLEVESEWGPTGQPFRFDASASTGAADDPLAYEWDLNGDGVFNDATGATAERSYPNAENVTVSVRVRDEVNGKSTVAGKTIYPGDTPPQVVITEPSQALTWAVGQTIDFAGTATEHGGAPVPASKLEWDTRLLHCPITPLDCHEHPLQTFSDVESGALIAPNHDYPSYVNFVLTATDARGLTAQAMRKVAARPVTLSIRSSPPGLAFAAGAEGDVKITPFDLEVIEDSPTTVIAPQTATVNGHAYIFERWSDGGAATHQLPATSSGTYTAFYRDTTPATAGGEGTSPAAVVAVGPSVAETEAPRALQARPKLDRRPPKRTAARSARFAFSGLPGDRFRCKLDAGKVAPCRSPRTYRGLHPGPHIFRVYVVDAAGARLSPTTIFRWRVLRH